MLNIIGITLSFVGTFLSIVSIMSSKYDNEGITWGQLHNLGKEFNKQSTLTTIGFSLMALGYLFQLFAAFLQL